MGQTGVAQQPQGRISGRTIVSELIRNMELGRLEMEYSILLPCIFNIYLHPDDYARLAGVHELIREDARKALTARMTDWNRKPIGRGARKPCKIAQSDWRIEFFADGDGAVPQGDVEIHSELNQQTEPGYRGVKTTLVDREPGVTQLRIGGGGSGGGVGRNTRRRPEVFAEIRYKDDSGPQTYLVTQDEVRVGRGGDDLWVDLPLYSSEEVSREHFRLLRDSESGGFKIVDQSRNGTWVNGRRLERGVEHPAGDRAEIDVGGALKLSFEVRR